MNNFRRAIFKNKTSKITKKKKEKASIAKNFNRDLQRMSAYFKRATSADPRVRNKTIAQDINNTSSFSILILVMWFSSEDPKTRETPYPKPESEESPLLEDSSSAEYIKKAKSIHLSPFKNRQRISM